MNQRERAIIIEVADALSASRGVQNPADQLGKSTFYDEMNPIRSHAAQVLYNLVANGATDEFTLDALNDLRKVMQSIHKDNMHFHITDSHPEWFAEEEAK